MSWRRRRRAPKDAHTRAENGATQPLVRHRLFNEPERLTEGWYPLARAADVARGGAVGATLLRQRVVLWRGADGRVRCLDAFCPHMGADLANGRVVGDGLQCYFHRWTFDGAGRCGATRTRAWPVEERYGWVWVWAGAAAAYPVPGAPGLDDAGDDVHAVLLGWVTLYAHHHVMMAGGIDLQHFASVHDLDIKFEHTVQEHAPGLADWRLRGELPSVGWRARLGRRLLGAQFGYDARFAGGSIVALTYGPGARLGGTGRPLPALHLLWGCVPQPNGVSRVGIFVLTRRGKGLGGWLGRWARVLTTLLLLRVLTDDDIEAFPHMRFNLANPVPGDACLMEFVRWVERLPESPWTAQGALPDARRDATPAGPPTR